MFRKPHLIVSLVFVLFSVFSFGNFVAQADDGFTLSGTSTTHWINSNVSLTAGVPYNVVFNCQDMSGTGLSKDGVQDVSISKGSDFVNFKGCGAGVNKTFTPKTTGVFSVFIHIHTNQGGGFQCPSGGLCQFNYSLSILPVSSASTLPEPPPIARCADANFDTEGMVRTNFTNDADRGVINCRVLASEGNYMNWFGAQITFPQMIGDKTVLDFGVIGAVDVFSPQGVTGFVGDVNICLKGTGYMIYMNSNNSPRFPQLWSAWTTDAFPGYTCTTLYAPGTVIMVQNKP
jgi:hypothetical protein